MAFGAGSSFLIATAATGAGAAFTARFALAAGATVVNFVSALTALSFVKALALSVSLSFTAKFDGVGGAFASLCLI